MQPENPAKFNYRLRNHPKVKETSHRTGTEKKKTKGWLGIKLKSSPSDDEDENSTPMKGQQTFANKTGTSGTSGTTFYTGKQSENSTDINTGSNGSNGSGIKSDIEKYEPLVCYFCAKPIANDDNTWVSDEFTEDKPAHKECYNIQQVQLRRSREDYPEPGSTEDF